MTELVDHSYRGKRVVDLVVLAVVALPALALGGICALAVAVTSRGPVFFRQERVGHLDRPFPVLKFRTMDHDDEPNPLIPDADRITRAGRWLRRFSLDELPQLVNVARGEMSIVGPRPTLRYQVERYTERQRQRLTVRPGLTGQAQLGGRNALDWPERIELDLDYVAHNSLTTDVALVLRTPVVLLSGAGVEGHPEHDPLSREPDDP